MANTREIALLNLAVRARGFSAMGLLGVSLRLCGQIMIF
jgi:hypothetical protein